MLQALVGMAGSQIGQLGSRVANMPLDQIDNKFNYEWQKKWQRNQLPWLVSDARKVGISPLAALGAPTTRFSPVTVGGGRPHDAMMGDSTAYKSMETKTDQEIETQYKQLELSMLSDQAAKSKMELERESRLHSQEMETIKLHGVSFRDADGSAARPYRMANHFLDPNTGIRLAVAHSELAEGVDNTIAKAVTLYSSGQIGAQAAMKQILDGALSQW
jgi:hypothetical protein